MSQLMAYSLLTAIYNFSTNTAYCMIIFLADAMPAITTYYLKDDNTTDS